MHAVLFSLVPIDNQDLVFAWGMEIVTDAGSDSTEAERKTVVYVGSANGGDCISTHESADAACAHWGHIVPLNIVWDTDTWADALKTASTFGSQRT